MILIRSLPKQTLYIRKEPKSKASKGMPEETNLIHKERTIFALKLDLMSKNKPYT